MTEVKEIAEINNALKIHKVDDRPFMAIPANYNIRDLEEFSDAPRKIASKIVFNTVDSFTDYVDTFQTHGSVVFADRDTLKVNAVIDYHEDQQMPAWCSHIANYYCQKSKEWSSWERSNGVSMNQLDFAEFLESHASDVVEPSGSELLELALKFQVIRKAEFGSAIRLNTGEFQFKFSEENQKGTVELPETITLGVSPFHKGEKYELKARLRYKLRDGVLSLSYHLINPEKTMEHAFSEVVDILRDTLGIPVYEAFLA